MVNNIKTTGFPLTDAVRDYAQDKIGGVIKFVTVNPEATTVDVELGKTTEHHLKGDIFRAEVNVKIGGDLLRAEANSSDLYSAIDLVREEIIKELKSYKGKKESVFRRGARLAKRIMHGF